MPFARIYVMRVPESILKAAESLVSMYGPSFDYLGKYDGSDAFMFRFPDDSVTGFPYVYLSDVSGVREITGYDALDIVGSFVEDLDVVNVE